MTKHRLVTGVVVLSLIVVGLAIRGARAAGIPSTGALSYSGLLEDSNGLVTGVHNIQLYVYDAPKDGKTLCQTAPAPTSISNGAFSIPIPDDSACTSAISGNSNVWVSVVVDGSDTGRSRVGAVPYAIEANHATNADTALMAMKSQSAAVADSSSHANTADRAMHSDSSTLANTVRAFDRTMFRTSTKCASPNGGQNLDCFCDADEIAITGGGWCGSNGTLSESAHVYSTSTSRDLRGWRIQCTGSGPSNAYVMCAKVTP